MLTLLTYASKQALIDQLARSPGPAEVWVTPHPIAADALRLHPALGGAAEVVTFANFRDSLFEGLGLSGEVLRKSRMLLQLNAYRLLLPSARGLRYAEFKSAYQIFSDLRAYVDAPEIPDELLRHFDPDLAVLVQLLHQACKRQGILDEHSVVFELTHQLRTPGREPPVQKNLVFDGFTFFTPAQLGLLEALALRANVTVPLPRVVFQEAGDFDWPKTLAAVADRVAHVDAGEEPAPKLQLRAYPKNHLAQALRSWRAEACPAGPGQIILATRGLEELVLQALPFTDHATRRPVDVLLEARANFVRALKLHVEAASAPRPYAELLAWLAGRRQDLEQSFTLARARDLAVVRQAQELVRECEALLAHQPVDLFLVELLAEVLAMDAPRNYQVGLHQDEAPLRVLSLKELASLEKSRPVALCVDGAFGQLRSSSRPFSVDLERDLSRLGPVRRPELEFAFLRSALGEVFQHSALQILIEEDLEKHDLGWRRILSSLALDRTKLELPPTGAPAPNTLLELPEQAHALPHVSATRLQDYLDCPRLYHAKRIDEILPEWESTRELEAADLGIIEHELVAWGWREIGAGRWSDEPLTREAQRRLRAQESFARLSPVQQRAALAEVVLYAKNGLDVLLALTQALPGLSFDFEVPLRSDGRRGSIDCLGTRGDQLLVLDFKRSKGSNPSFNKWRADFPKVQLWFYLAALREQGLIGERTSLGVGYLFFKNVESSWLACTPELAGELAATQGNLVKEWDSAGADLARYVAFEAQAIERLRGELRFAPRPRELSVCAFCALRPLCPSVGSSEEDAEVLA